MLEPSSPIEYVTTEYLNYQEKYAQNMRESDKVLLRLMHDALNVLNKPLSSVRILDIGCSAGNFLHAVAQAFPGVQCVGVEPFEEIVRFCQQDARLRGMDFEVGDVRELKYVEQFDIIISSAVLFRFAPETYTQCLNNICRGLHPGGFFCGFDFFVSFPQLLHVQEYTPLHPDGLTMYFRPMQDSRERFQEAGFTTLDFHPFEIPIDLAHPGEDNPTLSYTEMAPTGTRRLYRGSLYQPWCHFVARKP